MSAADVPLREVVKRLARRIDALTSTLGTVTSSIAGVDRFKIVETSMAVAADDFSKFDLIIVIADEDNEEPGLFRKNQATTKPTDGVAVIQDLAGNKFERFVNT